jgi:hypothetical protein
MALTGMRRQQAPQIRHPHITTPELPPQDRVAIDGSPANGWVHSEFMPASFGVHRGWLHETGFGVTQFILHGVAYQARNRKPAVSRFHFVSWVVTGN